MAAEPDGPRRRYSRWRAVSLSLVYVLMAVHVVHWKLNGTTLAPLELNEVMATFEAGIVTAGFLFMAAALLATSIFGRFFCSWGCHLLALQDLSRWILKRLDIRPAPVRSRLLRWVPLVVMAYMFAWPTLVRIVEGRPAPEWRTATDAEGWASFVTAEFARNLPSPAIAALTFVVCGFVAIYLLGSRGFCRYVCPYGAAFGLTDRVAPGRIRVNEHCTQCGRCTAACPSDIRVHEETARHGMVVSAACLKDLACVETCREGALRFGFGRPAIARRTVRDTAIRREFDFALWEDWLMAAVLVGALLAVRGLYGRMPFLLSLTLGALLGYVAVCSLRLVRRPDVRLNRWELKRAGVLLPRGRAFAWTAAALFLLLGHSAVIQAKSRLGAREFSAAYSAHDGQALERARRHLTFVDRWGLLPVERHLAMLGDVSMAQGRWADAETYWERVLDADPEHPRALVALGAARLRQGHHDRALAAWNAALEADPHQARTHYHVAGLLFEMGRPAEVEVHLREALRVDPEMVAAHYDLGALLLETGRTEAGVEHLHRAITLAPDFGDAYYNLAIGLERMGRIDEAVAQIERAFTLQPRDRATVDLRRRLLSSK